MSERRSLVPGRNRVMGQHGLQRSRASDLLTCHFPAPVDRTDHRLQLELQPKDFLSRRTTDICRCLNLLQLLGVTGDFSGNKTIKHLKTTVKIVVIESGY